MTKNERGKEINNQLFPDYNQIVDMEKQEDTSRQANAWNQNQSHELYNKYILHSTLDIIMATEVQL